MFLMPPAEPVVSDFATDDHRGGSVKIDDVEYRWYFNGWGHSLTGGRIIDMRLPGEVTPERLLLAVQSYLTGQQDGLAMGRHRLANDLRNLLNLN